jgi:CoA:oxalate CoA-transferase
MNVAWGDVRTSSEALDLPTVRHRATFTEVDDRGGGTRRLPESPYRFSNAAAFVRGGAPHQGEHNHSVVEAWLGLEPGGASRWAGAMVASRDVEG